MNVELWTVIPSSKCLLCVFWQPNHTGWFLCISSVPCLQSPWLQNSLLLHDWEGQMYSLKKLCKRHCLAKDIGGNQYNSQGSSNIFLDFIPIFLIESGCKSVWSKNINVQYFYHFIYLILQFWIFKHFNLVIGISAAIR